MTQTSAEKRNGQRMRVVAEIKRLQANHAEGFTAQDIAVKCNLKGPRTAGMIISEYMAEFGLTKNPWRGNYHFAERGDPAESRGSPTPTPPGVSEG
jgi:hypothetical protein